MEVKDIPSKKKGKRYVPTKTHEYLPQLNFAMCVVGPRGCGKSLLVKNLLQRKDMLKETFAKPNYIIIMCPSLHNGDYDDIKGKNIYKYDFYDENIVNHLMDVQKNIIEEHGRLKCPELLIVLDDILDTGAARMHSKLEKVFARGRHVNINIILISQQLKRISKVMRLNSDYMVLFEPNAFVELEDYLNQYISRKERPTFMEKLKSMWEENKHQFLMLDFKTTDKNKRYRKGFTEIL